MLSRDRKLKLAAGGLEGDLLGHDQRNLQCLRSTRQKHCRVKERRHCERQRTHPKASEKKGGDGRRGRASANEQQPTYSCECAVGTSPAHSNKTQKRYSARV